MKAMMALALCFASACMVGDDEDYIGDESEDLTGPTATMKFVQHNIEKKNGPLDKALQAGNGAVGITLQEVCTPQKDQLVAMAAQKGWSIAATMSSRAPLTLCSSNVWVVALYTGGTDGVATSYETLGTPEPGLAACLEFKHKKVPIHLCSIKLISTAEPKGQAEIIRRTQTQKLRQLANQWMRGGKDAFVVLGGDFNAEPDQQSIQSLLAPQIGGAQGGDFTEYNRSPAKPTARADGGENGPYTKKIDYLMFSKNRVELTGPNVTITPTGSDHDLLVSTAVVAKKSQ